LNVLFSQFQTSAMSSPATSTSTSAATAVASASEAAAANLSNEARKALFVEKVRASNSACGRGDFETAVALYSEAIGLDTANHILYSNRSAANVKLGRFADALRDAAKARELSPEWPKVSGRIDVVKGWRGQSQLARASTKKTCTPT